VDGDAILGFLILGALGWYLLPKPWAERKNAERLHREIERSRAGTPVKAERAYFKGCTNCRIFSLTLPFRDGLGRTYCSAECMGFLAGGARLFCARCLQETTDEAAPDLWTHCGVGKDFGPPRNACSQCGSVVRQVRFVILFLPFRRRGRYRVLYLSRSEFLSRRWLYDLQR
jgi:hypothetical protein